MSAQDIPQWAKDRAIAMLNIAYVDRYDRGTWGKDGLDQSHPTVVAFSAYIAAHEEPSVDPLLIEAREIVAKWYEANPKAGTGSRHPDRIRSGETDAITEVEQALTALRRGIELASKSEPIP